MHSADLRRFIPPPEPEPIPPSLTEKVFYVKQVPFVQHCMLCCADIEGDYFQHVSSVRHRLQYGKESFTCWRLIDMVRQEVLRNKDPVRYKEVYNEQLDRILNINAHTPWASFLCGSL